jgi:hypothetical protein
MVNFNEKQVNFDIELINQNNITLSRAYLESLTPWLIVGTCCLNWH